MGILDYLPEGFPLPAWPFKHTESNLFTHTFNTDGAGVSYLRGIAAKRPPSIYFNVVTVGKLTWVYLSGCSFPGLLQLPWHRFQDWTMAITSYHRDTISTPRTVRRSLRLQFQFDQNMSKYCLQPTFNIHRFKDWTMVTTHADRIFTPWWSPRFVYHVSHKKSAFCIIGHKSSTCRQDWISRRKFWLRGCYLLICLVWWKYYPNW